MKSGYEGNGYRDSSFDSGGNSKGSDPSVQMRVLVANVEQRMAEFLRASLVKHGIVVETAADVFDAIFGDTENDYDCIILQADPGVMNELFASSAVTVPVLAIAEENTVDARVRALDAGADDCLKVPFAVSELVARIRVLCRRRARFSKSHEMADDLHDFEYVRDLKLVKRSDRNVSLTHTEDIILGQLLQKVGTVMESSEIAFRVWGSRGEDRTNLVAVHVANLRRKIDRGHPYRVIHTARGRGYFVNTRDKLNSIRALAMSDQYTR
jgi:two-component system, OmpR family, copper resistance phosphate regulon response regulator CusR